MLYLAIECIIEILLQNLLAFLVVILMTHFFWKLKITTGRIRRNNFLTPTDDLL